MSAAALAIMATTRLGSAFLIQMTNDSPSAVSVDSARLTAACEDSIAKFEMLTGMTHNTTIHGPALVIGVLYYLELYKSREGAMISAHGKQFYAECKSIRELAVLTPSSNSQLIASTDSAGSLPDMDRSRAVFNTSSLGYSPKETAEFSDGE